ncbi:MAG: type VI secretion system tip protein VgrG [Dokdonia sp.]|jgi:Rhs element Vgr protein
MATVLQLSDELIDFDITLDGSKIKDEIEVLDIAVDMEINQITTATITIQDGGAIGAPNVTFTNSEGASFVPGVAIEIKLGYGGKRKSVFKGVITAQRIRVKNETSQLLISCKDETFQMRQGRFNSFYQDKKDSVTFKTIATKYGVATKIDTTTLEMPAMTQINCTDWDFILMRAAANNMMVITDKNTLIVKKIDLGETPKFEINASQYVIDIDINLNSEQLVTDIDLTAWNSKAQAETTTTLKLQDTLKQGNLSAEKLAQDVKGQTTSFYASSELQKDELNILGESINSMRVLSKVEGKMTVPGTTSILAGDIIALSGLSTRFNGSAFISRVQHRLEDGTWLTTLYLGMSEKLGGNITHNPTNTSAKLIPPSTGLHIATVKQIHDDPDNDFRVLVTLSAFKGEGQTEGIWARMALPYASKEVGFFFYPEVGDEVLVTFINNDPRFPVVTGALYSQNNKPKEVADEKNQFKSIFSKSGIQIRFDDEDKILHIATPEGHSITLDDKDKALTIVDLNKNQFIMNESGIEMKSPKDINIKADGGITLEAAANIELKATGDLSGDGMNVALSAQTGFTGKGNASAELSASGQTTVKGAMVMIN